MSETTIERRDQMADMTDVINECAAGVRRQFRDWVDFDDLVQEGWLWLLTNRRMVDEWLADEQGGLVRFRIFREMLRYARREKAERSGYSPDDEFFYSLEMLRVVLPLVLASDGTAPATGTEAKGRAVSRTYGDWEATFTDVRRAWADMDRPDRQLLLQYYVEEIPSARLAARDGCTDAAIRNRATAALKRLQKKLGGPSPQ